MSRYGRFNPANLNINPDEFGTRSAPPPTIGANPVSGNIALEQQGRRGGNAPSTQGDGNQVRPANFGTSSTTAIAPQQLAPNSTGAKKRGKRVAHSFIKNSTSAKPTKPKKEKVVKENSAGAKPKAVKPKAEKAVKAVSAGAKPKAEKEQTVPKAKKVVQKESTKPVSKKIAPVKTAPSSKPTKMSGEQTAPKSRGQGASEITSKDLVSKRAKKKVY